jgi:hypothetical protein
VDFVVVFLLLRMKLNILLSALFVLFFSHLCICSTDYYAVLGIPKKASKDEIRKAYKKLSMKYHPDKKPGDKEAEQKFIEIAHGTERFATYSKHTKFCMTTASGLYMIVLARKALNRVANLTFMIHLTYLCSNNSYLILKQGLHVVLEVAKAARRNGKEQT